VDKRIRLILGLHNHQPVGNFDHIVEDAYCKAYMPFLEVMNDYPHIPFAIHNSGVLWDWIAEKHPEYMELLFRMAERGQVELMSGGYYEPILSVIPERDRQGQLAMMEDFVKERFQAKPRGCWLTERIWEPHMPKSLAKAGLEYVVVDDSHFKSIGFLPEEMRGSFVTEEDGTYIRIFPIDKRLRYLIPFSDPEETISYLKGIRSEEGDGYKVAVIADDGEKFGLWPGTHSLCYQHSWLERLCVLLEENAEWLEVTTFSKVLDELPPLGIVYLPTASYSEMMEWALPLRAQRRYHEAEEALRADGRFEEPAAMVKGGFWRNFLVKYEESNWMHKRMLFVSNLVRDYGKGKFKKNILEAAKKHLYKAQCNCAYWHGLFGGLYLPHLRSAVYSHLIEAEYALNGGRSGGKRSSRFIGDLDGDGVDEVILSNRSLKAIMKLRGAVLRELSISDPPFNLTDTITRREESYHGKLAEASGDIDDRGVTSIHNVTAVKEKGLERGLVYDFHLRASLMDHFIDMKTGLESFSSASYRELGDFIDGVYDVDRGEDDDGRSASFEREGAVELRDGARKVSVSKSIRIGADRPVLEACYKVTAVDGMLRCRFAVESVLSLLAGNAPDRYFRFPDRELSESHLASAGEETDVGHMSLIDEWLNIEIALEFIPHAKLWRFPIETVSNSESGCERVYQGSAVVPVWKLDLEEGDSAGFNISLKVKRLRD